MNEDVQEALIDEIVAIAAVHPDAVELCEVHATHQCTGRKNIVVVGDGRVVSGECSASGSQDEAREPLDVSVLHEALQAAFLVLQQPELDKLPPAPTVHQFREQFSDHPNDWAPQWGPGVTLQLVITPDPLPDPGLPLNMCSSPSTLASDVRWESQLQITRLPPFLLTLHSVPHYPASELPALTLEAPWMLPEALEELVKALKAIADDLGPGMPVLLAWLGWLRGESTAGLSKLTIATTIGSVAVRMCPKGWIEKVPVRHPPSQADVLHMVLSHEARSQHEEFQAATHLCNVCLEHHLGSNGIRAQCGHWHCRPCLRELASVCMRDSNAAGVRCPRPSCRAALPPHIVQELMSQEELARWDELLLQKTLSSMRDVVFCPRCNLAAVESLDWAQCSGCHFAFCSLCYEAYHPGVICATPEQRLQVLALRVERSGNDSKVHRPLKAPSSVQTLAGWLQVVAEARRLKQALEDEKFVRETSKPCPSCGAALEKSGGCNKVVCALCNGRMCWKCEAVIEDYEHFRSGRCVLLDEPQIMEWEQEWERMVAEHHAAVGAPPPPPGGGAGRVGEAAHGARCPQCRGWCGKVARNNHLKCPGCRGDFCCLCGSVLRGKSAIKNHFSKNRGCPQHS